MANEIETGLIELKYRGISPPGKQQFFSKLSDQTGDGYGFNMHQIATVTGTALTNPTNVTTIGWLMIENRSSAQAVTLTDTSDNTIGTVPVSQAVLFYPNMSVVKVLTASATAELKYSMIEV